MDSKETARILSLNELNQINDGKIIKFHELTFQIYNQLLCQDENFQFCLEYLLLQ